jgi:formylmethanofuran dehydrogenase subunit C
MFALVKVINAEWVNGDVYVAATAKGVGFTGKTVVVQGDAVGMAGAEFTGGQHRFHLG